MMDPGKAPHSPPADAAANAAPRRAWPRVAAAIALTVLAAVVLIFLHTRSRRKNTDLDDDGGDDPRLSYATPFRNVRPDIHYVGDGACAKCHDREDRGFHKHPMGRSMTPLTAVAANQSDGAAVHNPFDSLGWRYEIERQGERVVHKEIRPDVSGEPILTQAEIQYAIGSGARTVSYLFLRGDAVFESPITWYVHDKRWNLSPGYRANDPSFERQIGAECLSCHTNPVEPIPDTINRFGQPLFPHGAAIGCERCHGPGELHVRARRADLPVAEGGDDTIVNPRQLSPKLREDVCYQCHLGGERRILRRGRQEFDFRPGLPLELFWTVFERTPEATDHGKFVGEVEQMHVSRCFLGSGGQLSCTTCHDPHDPPPDKSGMSYRRFCLECHEKQGCSETPARRAAKEDNCAGCHMPRRDSTETPHTAFTDHRIPRRPETATRPAAPPPSREEGPFLEFYSGKVPSPDSEVGREYGIMLIDKARKSIPPDSRLLAAALPYLDAALERGPRDIPVVEARAFVLVQQGNPREALARVESVLARKPQREPALFAAAEYAEQGGEKEKALDYWSRLVSLNPSDATYRIRYAGVLIQHGDPEQAVAQCRRALQYNAGKVPARSVLTAAYLDLGRRDEAQKEFEVITQLQPPNLAELRRWFLQRTR